VTIHPDIEPKAPSLIPVESPAAARPIAAQIRRAALIEWENEGGSLSSPLEIPQPVPDSARTRSTDRIEEVAEAQARLNADLAEGLVGERFNTYQHRARLVRQLRARTVNGPAAVALLSGASGR
jgi:hypothetical protein